MSSLKHFHSALPLCLTKVGTPMPPCFIQPAGSRRVSTLSSVLQPVSALQPWLFFVLYQEVQEVNNEENPRSSDGRLHTTDRSHKPELTQEMWGSAGYSTSVDTPDSINEPAYKPKPRTTFKFFYLHWVYFSPEKRGDTMLSQIYCVNCRSWFCCCCCCGRGCAICFGHIWCCFPSILLAILGLVLLRFWCHIHSVNVDYGGGRSSVPLAGVTAMQSDWQQVSYHAPLQCAHQQQSLVALKQQDSACHLSARSPKWSHEQKSP